MSSLNVKFDGIERFDEAFRVQDHLQTIDRGWCGMIMNT